MREQLASQNVPQTTSPPGTAIPLVTSMFNTFSLSNTGVPSLGSTISKPNSNNNGQLQPPAQPSNLLKEHAATAGGLGGGVRGGMKISDAPLPLPFKPAEFVWAESQAKIL